VAHGDAITGEAAPAQSNRGRLPVRLRPGRLGWKRNLRRFLVPVALLVLWQVSASLNLYDSTFLPAPSTVLEALWQWMFGQRTAFAWYSGTWFEYVYLSTSRCDRVRYCSRYQSNAPDPD
jgi:hypothetical protein